MAVTNAVASTTSSPAIVSAVSRLINISSRALVQTGGQIAIAGFVVEGPAGSTKQLLVRGIGPGLTPFGVSGVLANPSIAVYDSSQSVVASNTGWGNNADPAEVASFSAQVGAFALATGSADSALVATVGPGDYSVELTGEGATSGIGLIEVYETDTSEPATLANISTRAEVGTGGNVLIAGFVVQGTQPATVLVRAVGPALAEFSVTGFLAQPVLTVFDASGTAIGTNTGWSSGTSANTAEITNVSQSVGRSPSRPTARTAPWSSPCNPARIPRRYPGPAARAASPWSRSTRRRRSRRRIRRAPAVSAVGLEDIRAAHGAHPGPGPPDAGHDEPPPRRALRLPAVLQVREPPEDRAVQGARAR